MRLSPGDAFTLKWPDSVAPHENRVDLIIIVSVYDDRCLYLWDDRLVWSHSEDVQNMLKSQHTDVKRVNA